MKIKSKPAEYETTARALHDVRFPAEGNEYRAALNVFTRSDGTIHHAYGAELQFAPTEPKQNGRHVDAIWPLWNLLDYTPEGRGTDWNPKLTY